MYCDTCEVDHYGECPWNVVDKRNKRISALEAEVESVGELSKAKEALYFMQREMEFGA